MAQMGLRQWWNNGREHDAEVLTGNPLVDIMNDHASYRIRLDYDPEKSRLQNLKSIFTDAIPQGLTPAAREYSTMILSYVIPSAIVVLDKIGYDPLQKLKMTKDLVEFYITKLL